MVNPYKTILILTLLIGCTTAQERETGLDKLINTINNMSEMVEDQNKHIEDIKAYQEHAYSKWAGATAMGIGALIFGMFCFIMLITLYYKKKNLKSHEEYIKELEAQLESQHNGLVSKIKYEDKLISRFNRKANMLLEDYTTLSKQLSPHRIQPQRDKLMIAVGVLIGVILMLAAEVLK